MAPLLVQLQPTLNSYTSSVQPAWCSLLSSFYSATSFYPHGCCVEVAALQSSAFKVLMLHSVLRACHVPLLMRVLSCTENCMGPALLPLAVHCSPARTLAVHRGCLTYDSSSRLAFATYLLQQ
jgi:hypothetical protein